MSPLRDHLADYLRVRRALGFQLERDGYELGRFVEHLDARGIETITVEHALAWATRSARATVSHPMRLRTVRGFTRYLQSIEVPVEVPPSDLLPDRRRRAVPFLYTDAEIAALLDAAGTLRPPHRIATVQTLIGLLAVTGMRRGEAIGLDRDDFDPAAGVLIVRVGKFGKSRELPLHPTTVEALSAYLKRPDRPRSADPTQRALLVGDDGRRFSANVANHTFRALTVKAGLRPRSARCRPRQHDLRHTLAVRTLLDAYRSGKPVGPRIVALSTYLGHSDPSHTYWYLEAAPELMALAAERLERHLEGER
ncbi:MAG: tyrosine-type recombinase/integrase [Solirubrobacteraceae bacterium]